MQSVACKHNPEHDDISSTAQACQKQHVITVNKRQEYFYVLYIAFRNKTQLHNSGLKNTIHLASLGFGVWFVLPSSPAFYCFWIILQTLDYDPHYYNVIINYMNISKY